MLKIFKTTDIHGVVRKFNKNDIHIIKQANKKYVYVSLKDGHHIISLADALELKLPLTVQTQWQSNEGEIIRKDILYDPELGDTITNGVIKYNRVFSTDWYNSILEAITKKPYE